MKPPEPLLAAFTSSHKDATRAGRYGPAAVIGTKHDGVVGLDAGFGMALRTRYGTACRLLPPGVGAAGLITAWTLAPVQLRTAGRSHR